MFSSILSGQMTTSSFLICTGVSLILGAGLAGVSLLRSRCSRSFAVTLTVLPAIVQLVIMLVNGNIGAGVAVAGTFSLVRFRSQPGTAREITLLFLAVAVGLATGMGYVALAGVFFLIVAALLALLSLTDTAGDRRRILKITIPENLDYEALFDDLLAKYTEKHTLDRVRTSNRGTLYELQYTVVLRGTTVPKDFLDGIRCRNGNLNVSCGREVTADTL